ncbi:hypothetical protein B0H17DRAFT_946946 [Mycena rosella]|uniref:Uncharacterized protein n=1 Tax=Mycena rosella TaxID=1033263 RepID=A0AAD7D1R2_MYCRO|nr:hypothetical protein B0H17DRAFT_946946 [Mycena rosella]
MPHKRAKRSIREQQRSQKGSDLAPGRGGDALSSEPLPKSFVRAMNAGTVRAEFRAKRKLRGDGWEDGDGPREGAPKKAKRRKLEGAEAQIRPGETLAHFNKRVETDMRPLVRTAMQTSLATTRAERKKTEKPSMKPPAAPAAPTADSKSKPTKPNSKQPKDEDDDDDDEPADKHAGRPKEFARTSSAAPRRLNDIALAPPDLSAMARKAAAAAKRSSGGKATSKTSVLSPAQQLQMAAARDAAIGRYRELKAARRLAGGGGDGGERGGGAVGEKEE